MFQVKNDANPNPKPIRYIYRRYKRNETQCSKIDIILKAFVQCNQILKDMFV